MKTTLIPILLVFYLFPNCCYGQLADTLTKKDEVTKYAERTDNDNFKLSLLVGLGNPQGARIGFSTDIGPVRVGGGFGMGYSILLALFYLAETEYATSVFIEFPKLLHNRDGNLGFGVSFSHLQRTLNRIQIQDYVGVYITHDIDLSSNSVLSFGVGYDRIFHSTPNLPKSQSEHSVHIDGKLLFNLWKGIL